MVFMSIRNFCFTWHPQNLQLFARAWAISYKKHRSWFIVPNLLCGEIVTKLWSLQNSKQRW